MKVGLIGFFGAGAYSDDLIEHVTKQLLLKENPEFIFNSNWTRKLTKTTNPKSLNSFDLIINAGGSMLGKCEYRPIIDIQRWYKKVSTPMAIFGTGYRYEADKEPLNMTRRRRLRLLFEKADIISVRGHRTIYHLKRNEIDTSKIISIGDPVMACDVELDRNPTYIMGNVRNTSPSEIKYVSNERTQVIMAQIYDWLIEQYNLPLILISFREKRKDNDIVGAHCTTNHMKHSDKVRVIAPQNFMEAIQYMKQAVFWCGQRLHPTMFAAIQGIPFIGIEYQFEKMRDWASTVGINNYVDTRTVTLETFIEAFEQVPKNMNTLKSTVPSVVNEIHRVGQRIARLVE